MTTTATATEQAAGDGFALRSIPAAGLEPIVSPFTVVIDTREQAPWSFRGIRADRRFNHRPIIVPTAVQKLVAGDYSVQGLEDSVRIERKSLADLFGTLLWERSRFEKQLIRMGEFSFAAVVIEADWADVLRGPVERHAAARAAKIGKTVWRSIVAWMVRYPSVQWIPMPTRQHAEVATYRLLERFWKEQQ